MMINTIARQYLSTLLAIVLSIFGPPVLGAAQSEKSTSPKKPVAKGEPATWLLAGRDGECAPLSMLEKRGTEFRGIKGPDQLAEKMRAAGKKVEVKEHRLASRPAVEVRVPERGLYVMFVKADSCGKIETPQAPNR
jgi:hypothetical protein